MSEAGVPPPPADLDVSAGYTDSGESDSEPTSSGGRWWWRTAAITAIVAAFAAGWGAANIAAPQYTETDEYAAAWVELDERAAQLDDRETELVAFTDEVDSIDRRTAELDTRESDLDTRAADLDTREQDLDTRSDDLDQREQDIDDAELAVEENTVPGDGVFLVGTDIEPGRYRGNTGGGHCYWARLSGTSGDFDDLISNDNVDGPTVVTIAESDAAFETNRCGQWLLLD